MNPVPSKIENLPPIVSIYANQSTNCAIAQDRSVYCWGDNDSGQASGDGTTGQAITQPAKIPLIDDAVDLLWSEYNMCALRSDSSIWCWGWLDNPVPSESAVEAVTKGDFTHGQHQVPNDPGRCWVNPNGTVSCTGDNSRGQRGTGLCLPAPSEPTPVINITSAVSVISFEDYSCALTQEGSVLCWGGAVPTAIPGIQAGICSMPVPGVLIASGVAKIFGGSTLGSTGCALMNDSSLKCWGSLAEERRSDGVYLNPSGFVADIPVTGGVSDVAVADDQACVTTLAGSAQCWGNNGDGAVGTGAASYANTPQLVPMPGAPVKQMVAGLSHICVLQDDGAVRCAGLNTSGQLGDNTFPARASFSSSPILTGVSQLASNDQTTCALLNNGTVACWGQNDVDTLGTLAVTSSAVPMTIPGLAGVKSLSGAFEHFCAVDENDSAQCWGEVPSNTSQLLFNFQLTSLFSGAMAVFSGSNFDCVIERSNQFYCMGNNSANQLGYATNPSSSYPLPPFPDVVTFGGQHGCSLNPSDGQADCWGDMSPGGLPTDLGICDQLGTLYEISQIASGTEHVCVLVSGTVYCQGDNAYGEAAGENRFSSSCLLPVPGISGATRIFASNYESCALTGSGFYCWGNNADGQLGLGILAHRLSPRPYSFRSGKPRLVTFRICPQRKRGESAAVLWIKSKSD